MSNIDILVGDAQHLPFPDGYFHTTVTSPPYWGLRDYGLGSDSLGMESTPELYVQHLVEIFREVRRTLRDDGTLWLNIGDSYYARGWECRRRNQIGAGSMEPSQRASGKYAQGLKVKDLVGIPWMVAFALRADGWYLRSDIIWHKPNPMPESVRDRPTKAHEYLFLLSKSKRYYYDKEAISEPAKWERWGKQTSIKIYRGAAMKDRSKEEILKKFGGKRRNIRTVWSIPTQSYSGAHFAVFPEKLVEPCILAGCPKDGAILDPFAGSGTVGVVAQKLNRNAVLIDAKQEYCEMATQRCGKNQ